MHPARHCPGHRPEKKIKGNLYEPLYFIVITLFFLFYQFSPGHLLIKLARGMTRLLCMYVVHIEGLGSYFYLHGLLCIEIEILYLFLK